MIIITGTIGWGDAVRTLAIINKLKRDYTIICNEDSYKFFKEMGYDCKKVEAPYIDRDLSLIGSFFRMISNVGKLVNAINVIKEEIKKDDSKIVVVVQDLLFTSLLPFFKDEIKKLVLISNLPRIYKEKVPENLETQRSLAELAVKEIEKNYDLIIYDDFIEEKKIIEDKFIRVGLIVRDFKKYDTSEDFPLYIFSGWEGAKKYFFKIAPMIKNLKVIGRKIEGYDSEGFVKDVGEYISKAKFVVSTAGISTISECIYFRKPMLLIPIENHLEQYVNSKKIEEFGFGKVFREEDDYYEFIKSLKYYKKRLNNSKINTNGAKTIAEILNNL